MLAGMTSRATGNVTAVLGPTNTGKTHLAIERMCAHSSGIIGFPLRLLAREVYDRVVAIKGAERVALVAVTVAVAGAAAVTAEVAVAVEGVLLVVHVVS